MSSSVPVTSTLPHWVLELLAIGLGAAFIVPGMLGYTDPTAISEAGAALLGAGVTGILHDLAA